jgi:hypothetical protein
MMECWMSGLDFQILKSITWHTSVCFSSLHKSLWLSSLFVNSGLHHPGPLDWKFNNHWSGSEEIYGFYGTLCYMKACHWTLSWDMCIWSTLSHTMSPRIVLILSFCLDLGFWVFCSHKCFCLSYSCIFILHIRAIYLT